ncbi:MAG: hypothetical protein AAFY08_14620 [Planctomycetota bacterium]
MPKELNHPRPNSSISDMVGIDLVDRAIESTLNSENEDSSRVSKETAASVGRHENAESRRTGEHTNIQKMYRLTPSTHGTLDRLAQVLSEPLGFRVANSVAIRAILQAIGPALDYIEGNARRQIKPSSRPSTWAGNEHTREALEAQLAEVIAQGIADSMQ